MKRRLNGILWGGFAVVLIAALSYVPVFSRFPSTRDFPWANLALFATGAGLIGVGLRRAYRQPDLYRGRIAGPVVGLLSGAVLGVFVFGMFVFARQVPASRGAPRVGQKAPELTLLDMEGTPQTLASLASGSRGVLLIFYRGFS